MKHLVTGIAFGIIFVFGIQSAWAQLEMGKVPKEVVLKEKLGGRLDNSPWQSKELVGKKVSVVFYVDPDAADLNNEASEALKKENFPEDKFQSYAIVNMAATWLPNFVISNILADKQKKYQDTIYVRDYKKVLVKEWGLTDNTSDILAFDKAGKLVFRKDGKLNAEEIKGLIGAIRLELGK